MSSPISARVAAVLFLCITAACRSTRAPVRPGPDALPAATAHAPREHAIDVEHYDLRIALEPGTKTVRGECRVRLWPRVDALSAVELDFDGLTVHAVRDETGRTLTFRQAPERLHVELAAPVDRTRSVELAIVYSGTPVRGLYFVGARGGSPTQVFTQGECEDARGWFPCVDDPADRATSELAVTMPKHWRAVAAGERLDRVEVGEHAIEHWSMTTPHPAYLVTLVAGELEVIEEEAVGVPLWTLAAPALASRAQASLESTADVLVFLERVTGQRYPYPKYSQACVANFPFGGMENISATTLTDNALKDERALRDAPSTGLVAHEAAHQWFGDWLTCNDWSHIWLNEGFATYFEALFTEHERGVDEFRVKVRDLQDYYTKRDRGANRRPTVWNVYREPMDLFFTGHAYQGAAARLHLLRFVLGDAAFFRGIKRYVGENARRGVVTEDFRRSMESASGRDLSDFFEQWFAKPGFPEIQTSWRYDEERKLVLVSVNQVQDPAAGTPETFRIPIEIEVGGTEGARVQRVNLERRRELFQLPSSQKPRWVRVDPHGWIPKELDETKTTGEWLAIAADGTDVNGRRDAVKVLGTILSKSSDHEERAAVRASLLARLSTDDARAVRRAAAEALEKSATAEVKDALVARVAAEQDALARAACLTSLQAVGADAALAELAHREYAAGYSYACMAAAAGLVRTAVPREAFEFLDRELDTAAPELAERIAAELARVDDPRVLPRLLSALLAPRSSESVRAGAARELGRIGRGHAEVRDALIATLADESFRVRRAAIEGLGHLRDSAAWPALRAHYERCVHAQERRAIELVWDDDGES